MLNFYTIPDMQVIEQVAQQVPDYMRPNHHPYAVVFEGYLTDEECDAIVLEGMKTEPYEFEHCGAVTRELPSNPIHDSLNPIYSCLTQINDMFFEYDVDPWTATAWLQTYTGGGDYQIHMDGAIGQTRKLTAVAMLTEETEYTGGELEVMFHPNIVPVPKTRGTIVVFPHWLLHRVRTVETGRRQTINLGLWGAPFK